MPVLPSGAHCCINSGPLSELLDAVSHGSGPHIPDLLLIHGPDDLRRHIRLLWLLPLGADCATNHPLSPFSEPVPDGLTLVDSGHRMDHLPEYLDDRDRQALALFWETPHCRNFVGQLMDQVRTLQNNLISSATPEDLLLNQWFPPAPKPAPPGSSTAASDPQPQSHREQWSNLQAEEKAEQSSSISPP